MTSGDGHIGRSGFALVLVVFMLFAIAVAGITGYQVVSNEMTLAVQNRDSQSALSIARGGLQRFLGETVGSVGDSVRYAIGSGVATVTTRKVYRKDDTNDLYYIESTGEVADARTPDAPATRTVGTYAWHRLAPVPLKGALWVSGGNTRLTESGGFAGPARVDGSDHSAPGTCAGGPSPARAGVVKGGGTLDSSSGGVYSGSPDALSYSTYTAMYDTVGIRWDILKSPNFPVDFEDIPPGPEFLGSDSFPIVRYNGDLTANVFWRGQGVLIVTGKLTMDFGFQWNGIVLAGSLGDTGGLVKWWAPTVNGMLIGGMNGANADVTLSAGEYNYNYCDARGASRSLSYLDVIDDAIFEVNG